MSRQAIRTRYHGPTDIKGPRVSAKCEAGTIYLEWDDALSIDENHKAACLAMMSKLDWSIARVAGVFGGDQYHVEYA